MYLRPGCCLLCISVILLALSVYVAFNAPLSMLYRVFHSVGDIRKRANNLNSQRYQSAVEYIRGLDDNIVTRPLGSTPFEDKPELVIAIVTVARKDSISTGYLTQTVASLDKLLAKDSHFRRKFLFVCNVDEHPGNHVEAVQLQTYFHFVQKYGLSSFGVRVYNKQRMLNTGLADKARIRETEDYVFCLNASYSLNAKYVLLLEDDVIPHRSFLDVIHSTLKNKLDDPQNRLLRSNISNFAYVKLYYPLKWQGFALEVNSLVEFVSLSLVGGALIFGLLSCCKDKRGRYTLYSYARMYMYSVFLVAVVCLLIGRVNLEGWRRVSPQLFRLKPSPACCTQAMLFNRKTIPGLMNHLLVNNSLNKDLAIYEFSRKNGLPALQLEPNLFIHTGLSTSLSTEQKDPEEFLLDV